MDSRFRGNDKRGGTCQKPDFFVQALVRLFESYEFNYRWLSKTVYIQGVVVFQGRRHTYSMSRA